MPPDPHPDTHASILTRTGIAAVRSGDLARARDLLNQALQINPSSEQAWLWLSRAVETDAERRRCLEQVLAINPNNAVARLGLDVLVDDEPALEELAEESGGQERPQHILPIAQRRRKSRRRSQLALTLLIVAVVVVICTSGTVAVGLSIGNAQRIISQTATALASLPTPVLQPAVQPTSTGAGGLTIAASTAAVTFPNTITFSAETSGKSDLDQVVLEYGVEKQTCGTVVAKAFPSFAPGREANVSWTWEMRQSGSEPPGTTIWYRWRVRDQGGNEHVSPQQRVTWLDNTHEWRSVNRDKLTLHWYGGSQDFAEELIDSAGTSLAALEQTTGIAPEDPIDLYIYATLDDMRDAILYEPGWTGGLAFPDYNIVIIGIGEDQVEWGKRTLAHEITHVLVGHRAFSCIGNIPTWLNEGIAVYGEGGPEQTSLAPFQAAIDADRLLSVRSLSGSFSADPGKADLSYTQSYSLVNFLVTKYGRDKLLDLFATLAQATPIDAALQQVYGFNLDGLEERWRAAIGARPRVNSGVVPPATPIPTPIPTYAPISGATQ